MSRDEESPRDDSSRLYCDLTQSWAEVGGGVRTYLLHKRRHILESTPHRHLMIIPGDADGVAEEGRAITVTIRSPHVPGSPNYRLLLRNWAVRRALEQFQPDLIECQDAYNLPGAALAGAGPAGPRRGPGRGGAARGGGRPARAPAGDGAGRGGRGRGAHRGR